MAVRVDSSFTVKAPLPQAWALLTDVPRIAHCMPGAQLAEVAADGVYRGTVKVKIGPVALVFAGEAQLHDLDEGAHKARLRTRANDTKGRGSAHSEVAFTLLDQGAHTLVTIGMDLTLSGAVAQYGRGAGIIRDIAGQFISQFARNLEQQMLAGEGAAPVQGKPLSGIGLALGASKAAMGRMLSVDADKAPLVSEEKRPKA